MSEGAPRRIRLCADDYGLSAGVNRAIRELIVRRRINATSVMVVGPAATREEVAALLDVAREANCALGLHVTLTAPFHPLTMHFRPLKGGAFLPLGAMLRAAMLRRLDSEMIAAEIAAQLAAFAALVGRTPDYADGHQHVQIFPQVRDGFLTAVKSAAPGAWVRQCGRGAGRRSGPSLRLKPLLLDALSRPFRHRCAQAGIVCNPAFAGAYDYARTTDFGGAMESFFAGLPDGGLVMCHPGFVDDTLRRLDPLTDQREREYAYLAGDDFPRLLARRNVTLA